MSRLTAKLGIANATVHDLRRTMGTGLARLGVTRDIRARVLNHVDGARSVTDAVYNQHEFWAEKRAAMQLWEAEASAYRQRLARFVPILLVGLGNWDGRARCLL